MKQFVILSVALMMLFKPFWPIAEYIANYDYIVNVLCENKDRPQLHCDGKCYLAKQLAKASEQADNNPFGENKSQTKTEIIMLFLPLPQMDFALNFREVLQNNFNTPINFISRLLISDIPHPPELLG